MELNLLRCIDKLLLCTQSNLRHTLGLSHSTKRSWCRKAFAGITGVLVFPCIVHAEAWQLTPTITLEEHYDDNINMESESPDSRMETILRSALSFQRLTETSKIEGRAHANFSSYASDEQYFTFLLDKKAELSRWDLDGYFRRDTTTRTISNVQDIDISADQVIDNADEGLVQTEIRRNTVRLGPSWNYGLTPRSGLGVNFDFNIVRYSNNSPETDLFDHENYGVSGAYYKGLTERDSFSVVLGVSRYTSDFHDTTVNTQNVTTSYGRSFTETTNGSVQLGLRLSSFDSDEESSDDSGYILRLNLEHKDELNTVQAAVSHDVAPSGSGSLVETSQGRLYINRSFGPRLSGAISFRGFENKTIESSGSETRYYLDIAPGVNWMLTRWWSLAAGYNFRARNIKDSTDDAYSNSVFVSVGYSKRLSID